MLVDSSDWSLLTSTSVLLVAAVVIAAAGWRLAGYADRLADMTGVGEAVAGMLFLGATTSLPGIMTSTLAAAHGYPELAVSNALGGIAAQTVFLVIADFCHRGANLEHAAASSANILQGTLLISILALLMVAMAVPGVQVWAVHPVTPLTLLGYVYGLHLVKDARTEPTWRPEYTSDTREDEPDEEVAGRAELIRMAARFAGLALVVAVAGFALERAAVPLASKSGLGQTVVGGLFTAVASSLPELITTIAAVRRGALTLAVSGIVGGNAFDTLFVAVSDVAYREGSIYEALTQRQLFLMALTILMTGVLLMGLVRRERRGFANIGFESWIILFLYLGAIGVFASGQLGR
jgi:cation:H+ antiporter